MANQERLSLAIKALRDKELNGVPLKQGRGYLTADNAVFGEDGMTTGEYEERDCCLGVLCKVAIANGLTLNTYKHGAGAGTRYNGTDCVLPAAVVEWYDLPNENPTLQILDTDGTFLEMEATIANDKRGYDFSAIADGFEHAYIDG